MRAWDDHPEPRAGICYTAHIDPQHIGYLVSLVEAHEGLAIVRTKDAALGIVEFWISPLMQKDFESFLTALKEELQVNAGPPEIINIEQLDHASAKPLHPQQDSR
ncbi:MAG: DUF4911 domain-containing protein [Candidatus Sumerlaeaceae bacterium]